MSNITDLPEDFSAQLLLEFLESIEKRSYAMSVVSFVLMIIIFIVGVIGNLLTCIVIFYDKSMHTATNYYLFDLAMSDLIVAFGILLEVSGYPGGQNQFESYNLGKIVCKTYTFLIVALWNNGILIMTVLAIERYVAIWHPLLVKSKPVLRRVTKIMAVIATVAILETLPEIWTYNLIYTKTTGICFTLPTWYTKIVNGVLALVTFIIPLAIMIYVYAMIAFKVNLKEKSNSRDKIFNNRNNRKKVNKLIALTASFMGCWLPFFVMRVVIFTCSSRQFVSLMQWWDVWLQIVSINSWLSIVVNPTLFSLMSTKFRKALKNLWVTKVLRQHSEPRRVTV